ncbi:hypothetical protein PUNSTDRAFT_41805 [Punctularia strigosozonata HHB-11173 SS5]|uniref:uncharacterized protein n=1 Tax=Punctularia strigosozonata (strain HHB-11173) TaxID=741275 RepID=UPI00044178C9|nr:uncharacterized protein PUNSTDRAFT_41805 [Punctularia strigosozonata HHB-11173 SS5]EIN14666.1 hypothetical protein PUNSTDRAFT_41805 [Punctularia strigosozonata HHB-11173 SS5]
MGRTFLLCLPVRLGAALITGLQTAWSAFAAVILTVITVQQKDSLTTRWRIAGGLTAGVYGVIALVSLFGFVGACIKKLSFVKTYARMLAVELALQVATVVFFLVTVLTESKAKFIAECNAERVQIEGTDCNKEGAALATTTGKIELVVLTAIPICLQLYAWAVVRRFQIDLQEEREDAVGVVFPSRTSGDDYGSSGYKYDPTPSGSRPSSEGMINADYAYSDVKRSDHLSV